MPYDFQYGGFPNPPTGRPRTGRPRTDDGRMPYGCKYGGFPNPPTEEACLTAASTADFQIRRPKRPALRLQVRRISNPPTGDTGLTTARPGGGLALAGAFDPPGGGAVVRALNHNKISPHRKAAHRQGHRPGSEGKLQRRLPQRIPYPQPTAGRGRCPVQVEHVAARIGP